MSLCAGFLVWGEKPALSDVIGIAIMLTAGLYIFLRERHRAAHPTEK